MNFRQRIIEEFNNGGFDRVSPKTLAARLGLRSVSERKALKDVLVSLEKEGVLISTDGLYSLFKEENYIRGKIRTFRRGFAFLTPDDGSPDMFIPPHSRGGAYQGDTVLAKKTFESDENSDEAEVVKVLSRGTERVSGIYHKHGGLPFVVPDDENFAPRILVRGGNLAEADPGERVVCRLTRFPVDGDPSGEIIEACGNPNDVFSRETSVLVTAGVRTEFPDRVMKEAESIPLAVDEKTARGRKDFRSLRTVTIDGDTAKDFDDAISVERTNDGGFVLYVHIADVSEYVKAGGAIDREAYERGTSIYLPDRVIPMLPERLCNGICSLVPGEDRLTLSVVLTYDADGEIIDKSFYKSIIRSFKRLTYNKVQAALDGDETVKSEYREVMPMLYAAKELKEILLKKRREEGSVDLDVDECEVRLCPDGKIIVDKRESIESERIIEQFMIAANVAVAEFAYYAELPLVYRVHEKPSVEKTRAFVDFLSATGIDAPCSSLKYPKDYQRVLDELKGEKVFPVVNDVMLRSMQKAVYSSENKGHFGLNEKCYCHFTSPIRRYPDLTVHRILKGVLEGMTGPITEKYSSLTTEIAEKCTENERKADLVSRDVDDAYACKFMRSFIGDFFEVIVSGVTPGGLYVRLENSVEGFIPVERMPRGRYDFFERGYALVCGRKKYTLGDELLVRLVATDMSNGKIYFEFVARAGADEKPSKRK